MNFDYVLFRFMKYANYGIVIFLEQVAEKANFRLTVW